MSMPRIVLARPHQSPPITRAAVESAAMRSGPAIDDRPVAERGMVLCFARAQAVPLVETARAVIVGSGSEPQPARQPLFREIEQQPADPQALRLGRDEQLVEAPSCGLQGEEADEAVLVPCQMHPPASDQLPFDAVV